MLLSRCRVLQSSYKTPRLARTPISFAMQRDRGTCTESHQKQCPAEKNQDLHFPRSILPHQAGLDQRMVERSGVSPEAAEQQTFDSEIFDLELDAGLPSTQDEGASSTSTTPEAPSDSNDDTEWLSEMRPASEPVPLAPTPLSASYVVSYSNSDPQDGWGNLLGTSRR